MSSTSFILPPLPRSASSLRVSPIPLTEWRLVPSSTPPRTRTAPSMSSVNIPDFFSTRWYKAPPLEIEQSAHHIQNTDVQTDYHFDDPEHGVMALLDYPTDTTHPSFAPHMLEYIEKRLQQKTHYSHEPLLDLRAILASAINLFGAPPGFSAFVMQTSSNILRVAWVGACGFIIVRDDAIFYRSYGDSTGKDALEHLLNETPKQSLPGQPADAYTPMRVTAVSPPTCVDVASIQTDYIELQDNDLVIGGSDGLFSNLSEKQIMAFVRPVDDAEDPTLAIANNTCLGTWRYDDVQFISYYLAIIATNFATATNSRPHLPFPFPPSPHLDDVTVLCTACRFSR